jgi:hypothetical protein
VKKVLVDVTFPRTLQALGVALKDLNESDTPFFGIVPTEGEYPLGHIYMSVTFGTPENYKTEFLRFKADRVRYATACPARRSWLNAAAANGAPSPYFLPILWISLLLFIIVLLLCFLFIFSIFLCVSCIEKDRTVGWMCDAKLLQFCLSSNLLFDIWWGGIGYSFHSKLCKKLSAFWYITQSTTLFCRYTSVDSLIHVMVFDQTICLKNYLNRQILPVLAVNSKL